MLASKYSPVQLGVALSRTVTKYRKELEKPPYPEKKVDWIVDTTNKMIDLMEKETKIFNLNNPDQELKGNDLVSVAQTMLNRLLKALGLKLQKD